MAQTKEVFEYSVGIDLGTTYSCCHYYDKQQQKYQCLKYLNGKETIASICNFRQQPVLIGHPNPFAICEVKRLIGMKFDDPKIQDLINRNTWPFEIVEGENGYAAVKMYSELSGKEEVMLPEMVSAIVLKEIHIELQRNLGITDDQEVDAIVTVPAYFTDEQKDRTKRAALMSGFRLKRILSEPSSAVYAYGIEGAKDGYYLAFDLGGGTFDVTILLKECNGKSLKFVVMDGDTHLGGVDFDLNFMDVLLQKIKEDKPNLFKRFDITGRDKPQLKQKKKERLYKLRKLVEDAKIFLSGPYDECEVNLRNVLDDDEDHFYTLTREEFEECNKELFEKTMDIVQRALQKKNIKPHLIREVLLVGGSSQIPKIREMLRSIFGKEKVNSNINCDKVVSLGAARYAHEMMEGLIVEVKEVSTHVIKMRGERGILPIIEQGVEIPHNHDMYLEVYDVISYTELFEDDKSLGKFEIRNIPRNPNGTIVGVNVSIRNDGTLLVTGSVDGKEVNIQTTVQKKSQQSDEIIVDKAKIEKYFEK